MIVDGLSKVYGSLRAVDDVSLTVERGEIFGLLGPNGAGKSTTIGCLLGQLRPSAGSCAVFGADAWRERAAAHVRIGVLPSDFVYEDDLTGRAIVELFARLRGVELAGRHDALAERLQADLDRPLRDLSRGNRQKIGLVQALAHEPELVIIDEPTSGLDPLMQEEFLAIVGEIRASGRSVLMSSHNLAEIERSCDRVGMIRAGRLFEIELVEKLLERAPRHVHVKFSAGGTAPGLERIDGVASVSAGDDGVDLQVSGSIDPLLKALAAHRVDDLIVERPNLEQVFVDLYEDA